MAQQLTTAGQAAALVALLDTLDPMMARERRMLEPPVDFLPPSENGAGEERAVVNGHGRLRRFLAKNNVERMASLLGFSNKIYEMADPPGRQAVSQSA